MNREESERRSWKIRFADGTTYDGAAVIADLRKDLYGGDCIIEGR